MDLQGIVRKQTGQNDNYFVFTDPSVHCTDLSQFGETNLGMEGIEEFFNTHVYDPSPYRYSVDASVVPSVFTSSFTLSSAHICIVGVGPLVTNLYYALHYTRNNLQEIPHWEVLQTPEQISFHLRSSMQSFPRATLDWLRVNFI